MSILRFIKGGLTILGAAVVLGATGITLTSIWAQPNGPRILGNGDSSYAKEMREFKRSLTSEQRDQVDAVLESYLPTLEPLVRQGIAQLRVVRDAVQEGPANSQQIKAAVAAANATQAELAVLRSAIVADLQPIFTEEQKTAFQEREVMIEGMVDTWLETDWRSLEQTVEEDANGYFAKIKDRRNNAIKKLKLTDQQREQIRAVVLNNETQIKPLLNDLVEGRRAIKDLVRADQPDEEAIRAQVAAQLPTQTQAAIKLSVIYQQVTSAMDAEQLAKLEKLEAKREKRVDLVVDFIFNWIAT